MATREAQQARYWLTEKGWAAARCVSQAAPTTPAVTTPTEAQENPRD